MKTKPKFAMFVAACALLFSSLPVLAGPANSAQTEGTTPTQSVQKGEKQKGQPGPGKDVGKGSEDVGKGAGKGAESLGKGTAGAAGDLGKGAAGAGKDVGVGTGKGAAKIGKGSGKGIGKLGKKIFGRGGKNKKNSDLEN
jgi:hypothetical protein